MVKIALLEPYNLDSHKRWADGIARHSTHDISICSLPGSHWKWRMHGGAITLYEKLVASKIKPDLLLTTDMLDTGLLRALMHRDKLDIPVVLYFHENQFVYPPSTKDQDELLNRERHYAFLNYSSALVADAVVFNSAFNYTSFFDALEKFLPAFPDNQNPGSIDVIRKKSQVIHPGLDFEKLDKFRVERNNDASVILWNHRWEYDKNPEEFFNVLTRLSAERMDFRLAVCGKSYKNVPDIFSRSKQYLQKHIIHWGHLEQFSEYAKLLWMADILPVTSQQDFFGYSAMEAMYCGAYPLLPKRMAFPEHIESEEYFYSNESELKEKLKKLLDKKRPVFDHSEHLRKKYDWSVVIEKYDELFSSFS